MGKNVIEVILDTSNSMNEEILSSRELTKLKLAQEMIFNIFEERGRSDCKHKLYIRLIQNSKIVTIKNINEITKIEANENMPIYQVIESAIENLNNIDGKYSNKVLLIITDGKSDYYIDEKELTSKIKIYTMEIKGSNGIENETLQYLSEETKGLSYSVFLKDINEKNIDRMYSKIKKYFKCTKLPSIAFLFPFIIAIPLYLIVSKGCENKDIAFPPIVGSSSNSNEPIDMEENNKVHLCEKKAVNRIELQECTNIKKTFEAIIYKHNGYRVIALKNFSTGKSDISDEYKVFLKNILEEVNIKNPKSIKIFGHTDLEKVKNFNQNCMKYDVPKNTNECLGNDRAFQVKTILSNLDYTDISAEYNDDFFMRNINNRLDKTLWRALELNPTIQSLMREFNIKKDYDSKKLRIDNEIQQTITKNKVSYQEKFKLFRNVIILIEK